MNYFFLTVENLTREFNSMQQIQFIAFIKQDTPNLIQTDDLRNHIFDPWNIHTTKQI